jgi:hypothetical protein
MEALCPVPNKFHHWLHLFFRLSRRRTRECFITDSFHVLKSPPRPSAVLTSHKRRLCEICTTDPSRPVMLDEQREWERHCKSWRHQYLVGLKAREEEISAFQDETVQSEEPPAARIWLERAFVARTAWGAARRMRGAQQFAGI